MRQRHCAVVGTDHAKSELEQKALGKIVRPDG